MFPLQDGDTPLLRAVKSRNVDIVKALLDKKATVSVADKVIRLITIMVSFCVTSTYT